MRTILIVDDMPENLRLVRKVLTARDYRVLEAATGQKALEIAAAAMPDVVLVDLRLGEGEMTGPEIVAGLRKLPGGSSAVLVAFSGGAVLEDEELIREASFDGFIPKPFDVAELAVKLQGFVEKKAKL